MKTNDRRARADRALSQIEKLELEIRAKMSMNNIKSDGELSMDADYADFKTYSQLRALHEQYISWKQEYAIYADNVDLVNLVGQSEHDILREYFAKLTSTTQIITQQTHETVTFYEHDMGTGQPDKTRYKVIMEKFAVLPFHSCYVKALDTLFVRVNMAGMPS